MMRFALRDTAFYLFINMVCHAKLCVVLWYYDSNTTTLRSVEQFSTKTQIGY